MADRELLELAARAAGIGLSWDVTPRTNVIFPQPVSDVTGATWNPLRDDGEALRLAVQLGLEISFIGDDEDGRDSEACIGYAATTERPCEIRYLFEPHGGDIFTATRRAIIRAAAEIGKGME